MKGREKIFWIKNKICRKRTWKRPILRLAGKSISSSRREKVLPEDSSSKRRDSHGPDSQSFILGCVPEYNMKNERKVVSGQFIVEAHGS